jgi:hypothetical protein
MKLLEEREIFFRDDPLQTGGRNRWVTKISSQERSLHQIIPRISGRERKQIEFVQ